MKNSYWLILSVLIIALDQWSKNAAESFLLTQDEYKYELIKDYFVLQLSYNYGAAWSINFPGSRWVFISLGIVVSIGIVVWLFMNQRHQRFFGLGLSLVAAGALGNVWDRIDIGKVIDFLNASNPLFKWPIFNVADIAICIGVAVIIIDMLFVSGREERRAQQS